MAKNGNRRKCQVLSVKHTDYKAHNGQIAGTIFSEMESIYKKDERRKKVTTFGFYLFLSLSLSRSGSSSYCFYFISFVL